MFKFPKSVFRFELIGLSESPLIQQYGQGDLTDWLPILGPTATLLADVVTDKFCNSVLREGKWVDAEQQLGLDVPRCQLNMVDLAVDLGVSPAVVQRGLGRLAHYSLVDFDPAESGGRPSITFYMKVHQVPSVVADLPLSRSVELYSKHQHDLEAPDGWYLVGGGAS